uniref:Uncharacterized protein n=1 Tax=Ditylenchus dipsaci TaxID=166011 RepID=A0A915D5C1_9BILA
MEFYLFHYSDYQKLYNCSIYEVEDIPLEDRQHIILGSTFLILFVAFELLYIPCLFAIWKHLRNPCYKLMFFMGLIDVVIMIIPGFLTGIYSILGVMYCSNPLFQYFTGCAGTFLWALESSTSIVLAINRCLEIYSPQLGKRMFEEKRVYMWMLITAVYSFFYSSLSHPITFNGIYVSWFFNPHLGVIDDSVERKA